MKVESYRKHWLMHYKSIVNWKEFLVDNFEFGPINLWHMCFFFSIRTLNIAWKLRKKFRQLLKFRLVKNSHSNWKWSSAVNFPSFLSVDMHFLAKALVREEPFDYFCRDQSIHQAIYANWCLPAYLFKRLV